MVLGVDQAVLLHVVLARASGWLEGPTRPHRVADTGRELSWGCWLGTSVPHVAAGVSRRCILRGRKQKLPSGYLRPELRDPQCHSCPS